MTNPDALRGVAITEACRWEEDYWEMFAGSALDVSKKDGRLVPLGCLIAADPSLARVVQLAIGEGVLRDRASGAWRSWKSSSS